MTSPGPYTIQDGVLLPSSIYFSWHLSKALYSVTCQPNPFHILIHTFLILQRMSGLNPSSQTRTMVYCLLANSTSKLLQKHVWLSWLLVWTWDSHLSSLYNLGVLCKVAIMAKACSLIIGWGCNKRDVDSLDKKFVDDKLMDQLIYLTFCFGAGAFIQIFENFFLLL